ncbi:MAG: hypothetical protein IK095_10195 [Oscillospiraceae bacterium]|nr:hypothetical protein [Oscillospiraceae bacterium]
MKKTLFQLIELCDVDGLARAAGSFEELVPQIRQALAACKERLAAPELHYVTDSPSTLYSPDPAELAWTFLLQHPTHPFVTRLRPQERALLETAVSLDPNDYSKDGRLEYVRISQALGQSRMADILARYWSARLLYRDQIGRELDFERIFCKCRSADDAARLYQIYALCSPEEAREAIQDHLVRSSPALAALYPGVPLDLRRGETVARYRLFFGPDRELSSRDAGWDAIPHPFFRAHSPCPGRSAELFFQHLSKGFSREVLLSSVFGHADGSIEYASRLVDGRETEDALSFSWAEHYSYHDGGGGSSESWSLRALKAQDSENGVSSAERPASGADVEKALPRDRDGDDTWSVLAPYETEGVFLLHTESESWH